MRVLGGLEAAVADYALDLGTPKQRLLLALLVVAAGQPVPMSRIVDCLWRDEPPARAEASVHAYISNLRRVLEPGRARGEPSRVLPAAGGGYRLRVDLLDVDAHRFAALATSGAERLQVGDAAAAGAALGEALALWRGAPFADAKDNPYFLADRARLDAVRWGAVEDRAAAQLALGQHAVVIGDLEYAVAETPLRERLRVLLATALYRSGRQVDALAAVRDGIRALREEAGLDPGPELRSVEADLLRQATHLAPPVAVPGVAALATPTLPRDLASFTGRQHELQELVDVVASTGGVVGIHAIGGMAGVGKTAFAVHAAHRLAPRFPAGQIFLSLHGHTPGQRPVDPGDALAGLLLTAGVTAAQIPPGLEARMALWRDRVAGQRLLLVLDDAVGSDQVRPLLPGSGSSLVLVTSRRHLTALEDARSVSLDTLSPRDAAELLVRLAARPGLDPGDAAVAEITQLCGYLPLAVGMLARQLHHHPAWSVAGRAAELAAARDRLELMVTENLSVTAAFNLSYADLTLDQQRLFRRLGLHPGADIDAYAAGALGGTDLAAARRGLEALYDQYLLTEPTQGRYRMHDLIREHARALADHLDPDRDRDVTTARLLDYYQHTAALADALITRQARPALVPADGTIPAAVPALADQEQALAWARAERASLLACLDHATRTGQHARVTALTAGVAGLLRRDGPWADAITRHTAAIQAAQYLGDRLGEANALSDLGDVRRLAGDYPAAAQAQEQALDIYRDLGDRLGLANALGDLGVVRWLTGDYPAAARALEQALGIYRELGDRHGQAHALRDLGAVRRLTDDYPAAAQLLEEALGIYRDLGDRHGQANALHYLGYVQRMTGDYPAAARAQEQALGICRDLGDRLGEANALRRLGDVQRMTGDYPAAARAQEQALGICRDLGDRHGEANALSNLGDVRRMTGDYPAAARALEQALGIYRDLGDRGGEVEALNERGTLHRVTGDLAQAEGSHQQALELARAIVSPWDEAQALAGLGRCAMADGHATQARVLLRQALEIFQRIGAGEARDLLAELDIPTSPRPAQ